MDCPPGMVLQCLAKALKSSVTPHYHTGELGLYFSLLYLKAQGKVAPLVDIRRLEFYSTPHLSLSDRLVFPVGLKFVRVKLSFAT